MTNFKLFNPNQNSALSDTAYENDDQRQGGVIPGKAKSALHNKAFYQWSLMVKTIADFIESKGFTANDTSASDLQTNFVSAFTPPQFPIGAGVDYWLGGAAPAGWIYAFGTIGDGSSHASSRANPDTQALYFALWNSQANAQAPVFNSAGVAVTRGASALSDWNAHRQIAVPDKRGRVAIALDNMGGVAAGRVNNTSFQGGNALILGGTMGEQAHLMTLAELIAHVHPNSKPTQSRGASGNDNQYWGNSTTGDTNPNAQPGGTQLPFNVMQPTIACNYIIKL